EYDARIVRMNLDAAQALLDTTSVNSIVVLLKTTDLTESAAERLSARLGARDLEVWTWSELSDFYAKTVTLFRRQFGFLELVILMMILLCVLNSINLSLFERRGEFGTIRAMGIRNRDVFRMMVTESALLGLFGATLGVLVGIAAAFAISAIGIPMPPPPNAE